MAPLESGLCGCNFAQGPLEIARTLLSRLVQRSEIVVTIENERVENEFDLRVLEQDCIAWERFGYFDAYFDDYGRKLGFVDSQKYMDAKTPPSPDSVDWMVAVRSLQILPPGTHFSNPLEAIIDGHDVAEIRAEFAHGGQVAMRWCIHYNPGRRALAAIIPLGTNRTVIRADPPPSKAATDFLFDYYGRMIEGRGGVANLDQLRTRVLTIVQETDSDRGISRTRLALHIRRVEFSQRFDIATGELIGFYCDHFRKKSDRSSTESELLNVAADLVNPPPDVRATLVEFEEIADEPIFVVRWNRIENEVPIDGDFIDVRINGRTRRLFAFARCRSGNSDARTLETT